MIELIRIVARELAMGALESEEVRHGRVGVLEKAVEAERQCAREHAVALASFEIALGLGFDDRHAETFIGACEYDDIGLLELFEQMLATKVDVVFKIYPQLRYSCTQGIIQRPNHNQGDG